MANIKLGGTTAISESSGTISIPAAVTGGSGLTSAGPQEADLWRLHTSFAGDLEPLTNLERDDTYGFSGALGSGMTVNSGIFTFPSTGFYHVNVHMECQYVASDSGRYLYLGVTTNGGSNWNTASVGRLKMTVNGGQFTGCSTNKIVDVTSLTDVKVRFGVVGNAATTTLGSSTENRTFITFIKLGET